MLLADCFDYKQFFHAKTIGVFCLLAAFLFSSAAAKPKDFSARVNGKKSEKIKTAIQDKTLTAEEAAALIQEMTDSLKESLDDEDKVNVVVEKWKNRRIAGKTRSQAVQELLSDVRAVVGEGEILQSLTETFSKPEESEPDDKSDEKKNSEDEKKPDADPDEKKADPDEQAKPDDEKAKEDEKEKENPAPAPTPAPVNNPPKNPATNPTANPANEELIDLGEQPLSESDVNKVMKWIAVKVGAKKLPYCYRQSFVRPPKPLSGKCAPGLEEQGGLCYQKCRDGFSGSLTRCRQNCPAGYTDIGDFCQKPRDYGRGVGYGWKIGDTPFNYDAARDRCERDSGKGNCEKQGLIWYPKCAPGTHMTTVNFCSANCPGGWNDTGTGCAKPGTYDRGVGVPFDCPAGQERSGLLCYEPCNKPGYKLVAGVCWQSCPSQQPTECAAGCATGISECITTTFNMISAPVIAAVTIGVSIGTMGTGTAAVKGGQVSAQAATKMTGAIGQVKNLVASGKTTVTALVGGPENLKKLNDVRKIGTKVFKFATQVGSAANEYSKEFAENFETLTSPEIAREIDSRLSPAAAMQVKRAWGVRHFELNLEANGIKVAKDLISVVSIADPTGLASVVETFLHPICKDDTPFPAVANR